MRNRVFMCFALVLILAFGVFSGAAGADSIREMNDDTGYTLVIQDDAGLIDAAELEKVKESMRGVLEFADAGFLTVPSAGSRSNSATKAQEWGDKTFGPYARFTVFIIDMANRHLDIYASKPLANVLTAAEENTIADNIYRSASGGQYADCAAEAFAQIGKVLRGEKIAMPMKYISNALIAAIAALIATYLLISGFARKEQAVSMPSVIKGAGAGAATVVVANKLKKVVHHQSNSGGGFHGGGGGGFGGGGGGGSSGGHGF